MNFTGEKEGVRFLPCLQSPTELEFSRCSVVTTRNLMTSNWKKYATTLLKVIIYSVGPCLMLMAVFDVCHFSMDLASVELICTPCQSWVWRLGTGLVGLIYTLWIFLGGRSAEREE